MSRIFLNLIMSEADDRVSKENEDRWGDAMEWLMEQPANLERLPPSGTSQDITRWGDAMEWLMEQPEYSERLPPSIAPQTSTGKLPLKD